MRQRRLWTPEEDKVLKYLKEDQKIKKWSTIAKMMEEQYHMPNRTGKQCRQRYFNHLDSEIKHQQWTEEEEIILWQMHSQYGNRWTLMTNQLKGRSQNCIKNHFYSKLRKAVRRLNKIIIEKFKTQFKEIRTSLLYKILESSEDKFRPGKSSNIQTMDMATSIKNRLFMYESEDIQKGKQCQVAKRLIIDILKLQQRLKNESRHSKNTSGFLDPRTYKNRADHSFESEDNFSVYSSNSFNSSFQASDDQSQISQSENSKPSKRSKPFQILNKISIQDNQQQFKQQKIQEQQKPLRSSWAPRIHSSIKIKQGHNLLGDDLVQSLTLRPSKSQKTFSFQLNVEDKVSDIQPIRKTKSKQFQRCISEIARCEQSQDQFDWNDGDFLNVKSQKDNEQFHRFFDDPDPMEFQLRVFSPKVPSDDGKMIDEF